MSAFKNFLADAATINKIEEVAKKFEGYSQDNYTSLMPGDVEVLIKDWLKNFETFEDINYNVVFRILDKLTVAKDNEIRQLFLSKINDEIIPRLNTSLENIHICPLGEEYESSFRLSAFFNNKEEAPHYESDINILLRKIKGNPNAVIVFIDDFLFSGGQLVCIFKKLLGIKLAPDDTDDIYAERVSIENPNLVEEFKKHKIALYYHLTFQSGYENQKFSQLKAEHGLKVEIFQGHMEKEDVGCFGTSADIKSITGKSNIPFHSGVFSGFKPSEIKPVYDLLQEVGEQLLRNEHPESKKWNEEKFKKHALGYGGKAKYIMGEQNVPTATLTPIWLPSPENKHKTISVRDKTITWKSLFYRKPKRGSIEPKPVQEEDSYPKIQVKNILANEHLVDNNSYDLLTLLCLDRRAFIIIYGHEQGDNIKLALHLNDLEHDFFENGVGNDITRKRAWYSFEINPANKPDVISELMEQLQKTTHVNVGIVLLLTDSNSLSTPLQKVLSNLFASNPTKQVSIVIDCPTRNIGTLKTIQESLQDFRAPSIYISNQIFSKKITVEGNTSIFDDQKEFEHIVYYLQNILHKRTDFKKIVKDGLTSFEKIKEELKNSASPQTLAFSPQAFISEFENIFATPEKDIEDWQQFFVELISVCNKETPEFIEYLIYYAARSTNDFIRFSTLRFVKGKDHLIDYWVEGTRCENRFFENVSQFIEAPISCLMYPVLRYYNRHKNTIEVKERVWQLIDNILGGKYFDDYWLVEKIVHGNLNKYSAELLSGHSTDILKLVESGVDVFQEADNSILKSKLVPEQMMEKIILSTKMTGEKMQMIFRDYPHLVLIR